MHIFQKKEEAKRRINKGSGFVENTGWRCCAGSLLIILLAVGMAFYLKGLKEKASAAEATLVEQVPRIEYVEITAG